MLVLKNAPLLLHNRVGRNLLGHRRADVAARAQALLEVVTEVVVAAASVIQVVKHVIVELKWLLIVEIGLSVVT